MLFQNYFALFAAAGISLVAATGSDIPVNLPAVVDGTKVPTGTPGDLPNLLASRSTLNKAPNHPSVSGHRRKVRRGGNSKSISDSIDRLGLSGHSVKTGGKATYFSQGGVAGACGNTHSDSDYIVAEQYSRFDSNSDCGKRVKIFNTENGKSITAKVADRCPGCENKNSLDLSEGAFKALGDMSEGVLNIEWLFMGDDE